MRTFDIRIDLFDDGRQIDLGISESQDDGTFLVSLGGEYLAEVRHDRETNVWQLERGTLSPPQVDLVGSAIDGGYHI